MTGFEGFWKVVDAC